MVVVGGSIPLAPTREKRALAAMVDPRAPFFSSLIRRRGAPAQLNFD